MSASPLGPDWHPAGNATDFEDEDVEQVWVGQLAVAVYKANGQFYATQDVCTHEHAYLSDGVVVDCIVECPFHQGRFDVRPGAGCRRTPVRTRARGADGKPQRDHAPPALAHVPERSIPVSGKDVPHASILRTKADAVEMDQDERQRRSAPSPLVGEGWGGGS